MVPARSRAPGSALFVRVAGIARISQRLSGSAQESWDSSAVVRERAHGSALASVCFFVAFSCISGICERLSGSAPRRERNVIVGCKWPNLSFQMLKINVFVAFSCISGISERLSRSASRRERKVIVGCKWHSLSFQTEKIIDFIAFS